MSPMRDVRMDGRRTREDRATQPMDDGWLSFAKCYVCSSTMVLQVDGRYRGIELPNKHELERSPTNHQSEVA